MKINKVLYWVSLAGLATILPLSLTMQSEVLSQNSIEINRQPSTRDGQNQELKNAVKSDRDSVQRSERKHDDEKSEHKDRHDRQSDDKKSNDRDRHSSSDNDD